MLVLEVIKKRRFDVVKSDHCRVQMGINRELDLHLLCSYELTSIISETPSEDFTVTVEGGGGGTVIRSLKTWLVPWRTIGP